ncbi:ATP synthase F1 subunit epsilon [Coprococcus sp. AF21-14LB]|uniref:ATP synthase F1 subunit epsilon n=1 Tax=Coprococcus sp. AF21-14LB TaxID=2292231 RepID=UPI000E4ECA3F|nr:ATP synthase F1 subunit epsilon [Coprococcus sp. AF21-14LB]RGS77885.1 ATP synthase F1 subunit epsilon [Coprococcus sp. AF21-14LB]
MQLFSVKVVASNRIFYEGKCRSLVLPELDGEKGILAHHENMIIAIENGVMKIQQEDGEWIEAAVSSGFAQIINNRVLVLVLSAEKPEEIDIRRAQEAKERAEEQLRQKQSLQEYHISQASLSRAMTRIKEASKYR